MCEKSKCPEARKKNNDDGSKPKTKDEKRKAKECKKKKKKKNKNKKTKNEKGEQRARPAGKASPQKNPYPRKTSNHTQSPQERRENLWIHSLNLNFSPKSLPSNLPSCTSLLPPSSPSKYLTTILRASLASSLVGALVVKASGLMVLLSIITSSMYSSILPNLPNTLSASSVSPSEERKG